MPPDSRPVRVTVHVDNGHDMHTFNHRVLLALDVTVDVFDKAVGILRILDADSGRIVNYPLLGNVVRWEVS